jgi:hypothetical protein
MYFTGSAWKIAMFIPVVLPEDTRFKFEVAFAVETGICQRESLLNIQICHYKMRGEKVRSKIAGREEICQKILLSGYRDLFVTDLPFGKICIIP